MPPASGSARIAEALDERPPERESAVARADSAAQAAARALQGPVGNNPARKKSVREAVAAMRDSPRVRSSYAAGGASLYGAGLWLGSL